MRAKVVTPEQVTAYRWSSLAALLRGPRPAVLKAEAWLQARGGWRDDAAGLQAYAGYLRELARDEAAWAREGLVGLAQGWAIGTHGWRRALAKEQAARALTLGLPRAERRELRQASWRACLDAQLAEIGRSPADLVTRPRKQPWKIALAEGVRQAAGASIPWLAEHLQLGGTDTLRGYLHQARRVKDAPNPA